VGVIGHCAAWLIRWGELVLAFPIFRDDKEPMSFSVNIDREEDGRWLAEIPTIPGCLCHGATGEAAIHAEEAAEFGVPWPS